MFTGIVEEIGVIQSVKTGRHSSKLAIGGRLIFEDLSPGDSVAVNGVCLTAASISRQHFTADVMHETLNRSSLGMLTSGSCVNLERALPATGRFGGHILSGHIGGISLTAARVSKTDFAVSVIPHTARTTILAGKPIGGTVNLENDMIGKYIEKLLCTQERKQEEHTITYEFIKKNGY